MRWSTAKRRINKTLDELTQSVIDDWYANFKNGYIKGYTDARQGKAPRYAEAYKVADTPQTDLLVKTPRKSRDNHKQDTPQTTLCRECDDYAGDGMYCASNYLVYDFSTSRENCEADTSQTGCGEKMQTTVSTSDTNNAKYSYDTNCSEKPNN